MPVNFRLLQETGSVVGAKLDSNPFVTLQTIDKDPNFDMVNRMYRLSALENRVMMIDIEPKKKMKHSYGGLVFPPNMLKHLKMEVFTY